MDLDNMAEYIRRGDDPRAILGIAATAAATQALQDAADYADAHLRVAIVGGDTFVQDQTKEDDGNDGEVQIGSWLRDRIIEVKHGN